MRTWKEKENAAHWPDCKKLKFKSHVSKCNRDCSHSAYPIQDFVKQSNLPFGSLLVQTHKAFSGFKYSTSNVFLQWSLVFVLFQWSYKFITDTNQINSRKQYSTQGNKVRFPVVCNTIFSNCYLLQTYLSYFQEFCHSVHSNKKFLV